MVVMLSDLLELDVMKRASPLVRAGEASIPTGTVRWVHSSEVLEIAPLLRGQELLLSGGDALLNLRPAAQHEYIRSLAARHVTALAIQTAGSGRSLSDELVAAAEEVGLPLIELRRVVPFVEIAEEVNRKVVSEHVTALQTADSISQHLAEHLASSGPALSPLIDIISQALQIEVALLDPSGSVLEFADGFPPDSTSVNVESDIFVGSLVSARLRLQSRQDVPPELLKTVGERIGSILALAVSQQHRPTAQQIAHTALMRAVVSGASASQIHELCTAAGVSTALPTFVMVFRRIGLSSVRGVAEKILRTRCPDALTYLDGESLWAMVQLSISGTRQERRELLEGLRADLRGLAVAGAMGPTMATPLHAHASLVEARLTQAVGAPDDLESNFRDCEDFLLERLEARELSGPVAGRITQELLGELLDYDRRRGTRLLDTLDTWLISGCNSAEAARLLFIERQTLHKRMRKIFELIGGDPRGSAKLPGLYLAVHLAKNPSPVDAGV
jgi:PucR family transcriptional regulator, purine catabolism regulatory protein